jgi:hypothetical protein
MYPMIRDDFGTKDTPEAAEERLKQEPVGAGEALASQAGQTTGDVMRFVKHKLEPEPFFQEGHIKSPEELNKEYGLKGENQFKNYMNENTASEMVDALHKRQKAEEVYARFSEQHSYLSRLGIGFVGSMLDPIEAAAMFVPGVGEERIAYKLATMGYGKQAAAFMSKVGAGATAGMAGATALEPLKAIMSEDELKEWHLRDALTDVFAAAPAGALMHAGLVPAAAHAASYVHGVKPEPYVRDYSFWDKDETTSEEMARQVQLGVKGGVETAFDKELAKQPPSFGHIDELARMSAIENHIFKSSTFAQLLTGKEPNAGEHLFPDHSEQARRLAPEAHAEWDKLQEELNSISAEHTWGAKPTPDQLNDPAWKLEQELREHTKDILPVSWDLRVAAGEDPTVASIESAPPEAKEAVAKSGEPDWLQVHQQTIKPRGATSEQIAEAQSEVARLHAHDERYKEAQKAPSSLAASEVSYQKTLRESIARRKEKISGNLEDLYKKHNEEMELLRKDKGELQHDRKVAMNEYDNHLADGEEGIVPMDDKFYAKEKELGEKLRTVTKAFENKNTSYEESMFKSATMDMIRTLENVLRMVDREIDLIADAEVATPIDVSEARKIESIGRDEEHQGKVLAYHGTSSDVFFQRFKIKPFAHIGLHFGTVEQAREFTPHKGLHEYTDPEHRLDLESHLEQTGSLPRVYPVVLDLKNVIEMPDLGSWDPYDSMENIKEHLSLEQYKVLEDKMNKIYGIKDGTTGSNATYHFIDDLVKQNKLTAEAARKLKFYSNDVTSVLDDLTREIEYAETKADKIKYQKMQREISGVADLIHEFKESFPKPFSSEEKIPAGQQLIRDALSEAGYDGIRYRNAQEGEGWSYIVWKEGTVKSALSGLQMFNRGEKGSIAGMADPAKRTAWISAMAVDPKLVAREESGHAIKASGLFKPGEWGILHDAAINQDWLSDIPKDIRDKYAEDYALRGEKGAREAMIEEAIMHRFAKGPEAWGEPGGPVARLMARIRELLERVGNWMTSRGFKSANDVFRAMDEGKVASRDTMPAHAARRMDEIKARMEELEPSIKEAYQTAKNNSPYDIPSIANMQRTRARYGEAPAMPQGELTKALEQIYGPKGERKLTPAKPGEIPIELQLDEQRFQAMMAEGYKPDPDEVNNHLETQRALQEAMAMEQGYQQAAECLIMAGMR